MIVVDATAAHRFDTNRLYWACRDVSVATVFRVAAGREEIDLCEHPGRVGWDTLAKRGDPL